MRETPIDESCEIHKKSLPNSLLCVPDAIDCNDDYVVRLGRKEKTPGVVVCERVMRWV